MVSTRSKVSPNIRRVRILTLGILVFGLLVSPGRAQHFLDDVGEALDLTTPDG